MNLSPLIPPYAVQTRPLKKDATDNPMGILTTLFVLITFLYYKHPKKTHVWMDLCSIIQTICKVLGYEMKAREIKSLKNKWWNKKYAWGLKKRIPKLLSWSPSLLDDKTKNFKKYLNLPFVFQLLVQLINFGNELKKGLFGRCLCTEYIHNKFDRLLNPLLHLFQA
jgi:hypothetical protein